MRVSLETGAVGARNYLLLNQDLRGALHINIVTVPDAFMQTHFDCFATAGADMARIIACFRERAPYVPGISARSSWRCSSRT